MFKKAERKQAKLRLALAGPSGSGKTFSALLMAKGLGGRIAVIDTEQGSASLYSDIADFDVLELQAPFAPERYVDAITAAEAAGYNVLIIDSYSHEWTGPGGCLEANETLAHQKFRGNTWAAWNETTPRHRQLTNKILTSSLHVICTMRSKTETVQGEGKKIVKLGMKSEQRDGTDYEFTVVLERNLTALHRDLITGQYRPGRSICFVVTRPKAREVWAADFRDRIVHHLLYNRIGPRIESSFIADSCACIRERGTLYAAKRLEAKIRSQTQNWSKPAFYLKCDLANFFVAIDKRVLAGQLSAKITEPWWRALALQVLMHDPRTDYQVRSPAHLFSRVPQHKRLTAQPAHLGLPIGNLSSQFFANVYLDALDQFCKHRLGAKHYVRYVDDFVLLHESARQLNAWKAEIEAFLPKLGARLNPSKTILQPIDRGVDFVGHVIKPWRRTTRKRSVGQAMKRTAVAPAEQLRETANSYFGLLTQASHSQKDRAALANLVLQRGHMVNGDLTKTYPKR